MKIDLHVHTRYSVDSIIKPRDLAAKSKKLGIIPAITDHNTIVAHPHMRSSQIAFIPGIEIRTEKGDIIALYANEMIPKKTPFLEALDKIHEQGAISYLPHMYDSGRAGVVPEEKEIPKIDIIEIFNGRCLEDVYNSKAKSFAEKHKKIQAVGSDSHFLLEFGSTYNEVPDFDLDNPKQLLKALKKASFVTKKVSIPVRLSTGFVKLGKILFKS